VRAAVLAAVAQITSQVVKSGWVVAESCTIWSTPEAAGSLLLLLEVVTVCLCCSGLWIRSFCWVLMAEFSLSIADAALARSLALLR
jgi:hypothetical protein